MSCIPKKIDSSILVPSAKPNMTKRRDVRVWKKGFRDYVGMGKSSFNSGSWFSNRVVKNSSLSISPQVMNLQSNPFIVMSIPWAGITSIFIIISLSSFRKN